MTAHYISLVSSYAIVVILWFVLNRLFTRLWAPGQRITFANPLREFLYALIALAAVIGIGQLYVRDWMLPGQNVLIDAANQILIFCPVLILIAIRKHNTNTVWLPLTSVATRVFLGLLLASAALITYHLTRSQSTPIGEMITDIYHPQNLSYAVQIFMEDLAIALLFVRLAAWIGLRWSIVLVAVLFAAGHIPSLIADGATFTELGSLVIDAGLGVMVLLALSRSRDIWWFFMVHFAMDMTQFYGGS